MTGAMDITDNYVEKQLYIGSRSIPRLLLEFYLTIWYNTDKFDKSQIGHHLCLAGEMLYNMNLMLNLRRQRDFDYM